MEKKNIIGPMPISELSRQVARIIVLVIHRAVTAMTSLLFFFTRGFNNQLFFLYIAFTCLDWSRIKDEINCCCSEIPLGCSSVEFKKKKVKTFGFFLLGYHVLVNLLAIRRR